MQFSKIESSYTSKDGCRLVWKGVEEDDSDPIILNKKALEQLIDLLKEGSSGEVELEDQVSRIMVNSDVTEFNLKDHNLLEVKTADLQKHVLDYAKFHIHHSISISAQRSIILLSQFANMMNQKKLMRQNLLKYHFLKRF